MADEPAAPVATPPAQISGPWAADIQTLTSDPALQAAVDNFMRSKIQPRMTQLEQQVASAQTAQQLWDAFNNDPEGTYRALTTELYGAEAAEAMLAAIQGGQQPAAPAQPQTVQQPPAPVYDPSTMLSPEEVQAFRQRQELEAYDAAVDQILSDPANADIDRDRYHTFVAAADGNFEEALVRYRDDTTKVLLRYGIDPATATPTQQHQAASVAEAEQRAQAPVVMGSDAGGAGAPLPTQPEYRGMDGLRRAIDDTVAQMRRNAEAPPVA